MIIKTHDPNFEFKVNLIALRFTNHKTMSNFSTFKTRNLESTKLDLRYTSRKEKKVVHTVFTFKINVHIPYFRINDKSFINLKKVRYTTPRWEIMSRS